MAEVEGDIIRRVFPKRPHYYVIISYLITNFISMILKKCKDSIPPSPPPPTSPKVTKAKKLQAILVTENRTVVKY